MSRSLLAAWLMALASHSIASAEQPQALAMQRTGWSHVSPVRVVSWDDEPTVEELLEQLEETEAELQRAYSQLDAAYETAERFGTEEELQLFREATGWNLDDSDMIDFNVEPDGLDTPGPGGNMGDMATQSQNPVGGLWMMWLQNDMHLYEGPFDGKRIFNTTVFQPVMPVQINDCWKLINRPVFLFHSFETPDTSFSFNPGGSFPPVAPPNDPFSTQAGLGDIGLIQWLSNSPSDSRMVTGFGWNWMFPAATFPDLGTGRTSFGPSAVAMYLGDKIIAGGIMQQYFSIDSRQDRQRVSYMDVQYVFRYRLNPMFSVGFAPNVKWDQVTGRVNAPIGFGFDTMTLAFGKAPLRMGAEIQYFASHESGNRQFDPEWNFRLYVSPIIRAPEWATRGLLGGNCCD